MTFYSSYGQGISDPGVIMRSLIFALFAILPLNVASAQRQMETLTRGVVAVPTENGDHLVTWRLFGTDPETIGFHLHHRQPVRQSTAH